MRPQDIEKRVKKNNLCAEIDDLDKIGRDVVRFTKLDDESREEWLKRSKRGMDLALHVVEEKNSPWPNASNVKYPLITSAALQFQARAYSSIVQGSKIVKGQVTGEDSQGDKLRRAKRISAHMNWQLLEENEDWEPDIDRMLLALSIEGCEFKKSYFSKESGHNISEWVRPEDFIVHNKTRSLQKAPRITHRLWYYPHEIDTKMRSGLWRDAELQISSDEQEEEKLQEFYEQHTFLDLDEDGYKEPYIVTVHVKSEQVVRVVCGFYAKDVKMKGNKITHIPRIDMFTKYGFIPSPDGSFYDLGFGWLIGPLSDAVDTNINQLIDAGTLANRGAGFVQDGVSINGKRGDIQFKMGEFQRIKLPAGRSIQESIFQMQFKEPSLVLFQLLGTLIQAAKDVTSVQDIMTGASAPNEEKATTSMIRVEQGMKVFSAIYKRIYRSLKHEFKKLYNLNAMFLEPEQYFTVLDTKEQMVAYQTDYQGDPSDVQPVADPQIATTMLAFAKNQQLLSVMSHPLVDDAEVLRRFFEGLEVPSPETLLVPEEKRQPPPNPELMLKLQVAASEHEGRKMKMLRDYADAMKKFAEAESVEEGNQWQQYMHMIETVMGVIHGQGSVQPMAVPPGNPGVPQVPPQMPRGIPQGGPVGPNGPGPR